ncbi:MAG: PAS domain-containing protein [Sphaerochaetaceae bacterium]|jgi:PAS domain S-box-containing protein|nr:PAS domain-containing protein [Sphaerochaetaceae bacterium]MDY0371933.1 PAS domain-containing protein [Sphaerochaetaceae bacterium]
MEIAGQTISARQSVLLPYCLGLADPASNTANLAKARPLFETVTPQETMQLVDTIVQTVDDINLVKTIVTRMLHSFAKALLVKIRPFERTIPFFEQLLAYNDQIIEILDNLKPVVSQINMYASITVEHRGMLRNAFKKLSELIDLYEKKENILFPIVEKYVEESRCVVVMWAIHDDIRETLQTLQRAISDKGYPLSELNKLLGNLFFDVKTIVFREEQVLIPAIIDHIPRQVLLGLSEDQHDQGQVDPSQAQLSDGQIDLITGNPTARQLLQIFNNLPVDITLVDAEDRVVYFNTPEHRIFPRAKAVVGRTVQNCHPPTSVHIVQRILEAFHKGTQKYAEFRINLKGRFIRITYTAIYDEAGVYEGTLEVTQDITDIKELEGEMRLLDWKE